MATTVISASPSAGLFLGNASGEGRRVKVHPVVVLTILDHFVRRNEDQQRVIGTLLGRVNEEGEIEVRNCFAVPHSEKDDQVSVSTEVHTKMVSLQQKVNPKEVVLGWYTTGDEITYTSSIIHDFYAREVTDAKELQQPIHLTVDTALKNNRLGIQVYDSTPVGVSSADGAIGYQFRPLPSDLKFIEAERIGMELLARANEGTTRTTTLLSDLDNLERSLERVNQMLETVKGYVENAANGKVSPDANIGRFLMDTVAGVPQLDQTQFEQIFHGNLQDLLMVVYLSNLTRTQLAIAERLHSIV